MKWCLIIFSLWFFNIEQIASSSLNCLQPKARLVSRGVRKLYYLLNIYCCLILDFILTDSNNVQRFKKSLIPLTNKCLEDNRVSSLLLIMVLYHISRMVLDLYFENDPSKCFQIIFLEWFQLIFLEWFLIIFEEWFYKNRSLLKRFCTVEPSNKKGSKILE